MMKLHRRAGDDRGSLPMVMMVTFVGLALSVAFLPTIVRQVVTTRSFIDRDTALNGARIGMDVVMARVAAASEKVAQGDVRGLLEDLPKCLVEGDAGVSAAGEKLAYKVTITYYSESGKKLDCPLKETPKTARLESQGFNSRSPGSRILDGTYTFAIDNSNVDGGAIRISSSTIGDLCMDGVQKSPAPGAAVVMRRCDGGSTQQFQYTKELYVRLVNSETATAAKGMCLYAGADAHKSGTGTVFQPCPSGTAIATQFQWSLDGSSVMHSAGPDRKVENLCLNLKTASKVDTPLQLGSCGASGTLNVWRFDPGVGAGMAGEETYQLVNYAQFSRCLDVTNKDTGYAYMIAWFCKQDPSGVVEWNQIWVHPIPVEPATEKDGPIVVTKDNVKYCLRSPLTGESWVTTERCPSNLSVAALPDRLIWKVRHQDKTYTKAYRIEDRAGLCLQPTDLAKATKDTTHSDGTSRVKVAACGASELQKWNAPANLSGFSPIGDVTER
ncbi:ricin-type beta-trefoil lectin domain protein [Actinoplanes flavus]|uniref:Ricin-type beta-trefoil lectin domain protein n=1 Tax=Actinoplanes flavus TaxID=2820290 RepID=A0ABS3UAW3_9ACTN|nr:ricin-type beta-trefoil lectin domain protein [Actinoplanes flavus]MBO3735905.1 ricin-type beta-trefoil lectin domain protein [Actinoplanes flavus]